jgi:ATP-dependent DNA helicase DinG
LHLEVLRRLGDPNDAAVVWIEKVGRTRRIKVAPVFVGPALGGMLLDARPVIAVSATLGGEPPFAGLAAQMGFDSAAAPGTWGERNDDGTRNSTTGRGYVPLQAASSFDWRQQGLLYAGHDLPDPRRFNETWVKKAGDRLCKLVNAAGGRSCSARRRPTSNASPTSCERTDHDVLAQGDADVARLTRSFIANDVLGWRLESVAFCMLVACVLVVIDRIPFPSPGDPLHAARRERAEAMELNAFGVVDLPAAALVLAQGAGRLIRTRDDHGVVAVLDSRLANRDYRVQLLTAMPPFKRSVDLDETCDFLKEAARRVPKSRATQPASAAPPPVTEAEVLASLSPKELTKIRNGVSCPECGAEPGARCHDENGWTMAFPHDARTNAAHDA